MKSSCPHPQNSSGRPTKKVLDWDYIIQGLYFTFYLKESFSNYKVKFHILKWKTYFQKEKYIRSFYNDKSIYYILHNIYCTRNKRRSYLPYSALQITDSVSDIWHFQDFLVMLSFRNYSKIIRNFWKVTIWILALLLTNENQF